MQNLWPYRIRSASYVVGTTMGLILSSAVLPVELTPGLRDWFAKSAIAQNVDEQTNIEVYRAASPAVVAIGAGDGSGSGTIITSDGLILTNAHVVGNSSTAQVRLNDGREFTGDVIGFPTSRVDLAAIQLRNSPSNLPTINIAPAGSVQVGQRAFAIGNPFGLEGTFTTGIVSRIDPERGLIQTDAAINPGNSGGPLLGSDGRLIGVNTSIFTTQRSGGNIGIGFAIPVQEVQTFVAELNNGTALTTTSAMGGRGRLEPIQIALNDVITGRLDDQSDVLPDGSFFNAYIFQGRQGQRISVEMNSSELDPYLILLSEGNDSLYLEDDDSAGNFNARLEATLPTDGEYIIIANSYGGGEQGRYDLSVSDLGATQAGSGSSIGSYILQQSGQLARGDLVAPDNTFYDQYTFEGSEGQFVTVTVTSQEFDTYLAVVDSEGNVVAQNDDLSSSTTNSEVAFRLPSSGTYLVIVNGYSTADIGRYELTIR